MDFIRGYSFQVRKDIYKKVVYNCAIHGISLRDYIEPRLDDDVLSDVPHNFKPRRWTSKEVKDEVKRFHRQLEFKSKFDHAMRLIDEHGRMSERNLGKLLGCGRRVVKRIFEKQLRIIIIDFSIKEVSVDDLPDDGPEDK